MIEVVYTIECFDMDSKKRSFASEFWTDFKEAESEADLMNYLYTETSTHKFALVRTLYNFDLRKPSK